MWLLLRGRRTVKHTWPVYPAHGWHENATDGWNAADGNGRIFHANHATASKILHTCSDSSSAKMATTASCAPPRWNARHGYAKRTSPWRSTYDRSSPSPHGTARPPAHDYDGKARNATCTHGSSASQASAELQVHTSCQEPSSSGDA